MADHEITITEDMTFDPTPKVVKKDDRVVWFNSTDDLHTATAKDGTWNTGDIPPGKKSKPISFPKAGDSPYRCRYHSSMEGVVTVTN
jgi:plastocyanin